jgi:hypothetical protein
MRWTPFVVGSLAVLSVAPPIGVADAFAAPTRVVARGAVPLERETDGTMSVAVMVNGAGPFRFLLDTGSAGTSVSDDLARRLDAPAVARAEVTSAAGVEPGLIVRLDGLAVGGRTAEGLLATVVPAERLRGDGAALDGVLGQDFLARFNYTLDYGRARLEWDGDDEGNCGDVRLPLESVEGRFLVALPQDDGSTLRLVPDSGASAFVVFDRPAGPRLPMLLSGGRRRLETLTGARDVTSGTLLALRVGALTLRRAPVAVVRRDDWRPAFGDALLPLRMLGRVSIHARDGWMAVER